MSNDRAILYLGDCLEVLPTLMDGAASMTPRSPSQTQWEKIKKDFIALLPTVASSYDTRSVFCDACRVFSLSLRSPLATTKEERDAIEKEYQSYVRKYGEDGMKKIGTLFALLVDALEIHRGDFLGHVYEEINATNAKGLGQFFTPDCVSRLMAKMNFGNDQIEKGKIVKLCDPACGAGALMIEASEEFMLNGGRQGDLLIYGDDLDPTAVCIAYVQFSLLGYPAIVRRMDSLAMQVYEGPWYTMGYFAHALPMRLLASNSTISPSRGGDAPPSPAPAPDSPASGDSSPRPPTLQQGELPL